MLNAITNAVITLADAERKINAIKMLRQASNGTLGLKEAKDLVEMSPFYREDRIRAALAAAGWQDGFVPVIKSKPSNEDRYRDMLDYARQAGSLTFGEMNAYAAGHKAGSR